MELSLLFCVPLMRARLTISGGKIHSQIPSHWRDPTSMDILNESHGTSLQVCAFLGYFAWTEGHANEGTEPNSLEKTCRKSVSLSDERCRV